MASSAERMSSVRMLPRASRCPVATRRLTQKAPKGPLENTRVSSLFPSERTRNSLMTSEREDDRRDDHVRVHAALKTVGQSRQSPVGDDSRDANFARLIGEDVGASDQVFDSDSVEKLDIRELESRLGVESDKVERGEASRKVGKSTKRGGKEGKQRSASAEGDCEGGLLTRSLQWLRVHYHVQLMTVISAVH